MIKLLLSKMEKTGRNRCGGEVERNQEFFGHVKSELSDI